MNEVVVAGIAASNEAKEILGLDPLDFILICDGVPGAWLVVAMERGGVLWTSEPKHIKIYKIKGDPIRR